MHANVCGIGVCVCVLYHVENEQMKWINGGVQMNRQVREEASNAWNRMRGQ